MGAGDKKECGNGISNELWKFSGWATMGLLLKSQRWAVHVGRAIPEEVTVTSSEETL